MKTINLTSGAADRKVANWSFVACKRLACLCLLLISPFLVYMLSLGPVLRICNRLPEGADRPGWFLVIYGPALSAQYDLPSPIREAYSCYLDWWNTRPRSR